MRFEQRRSINGDDVVEKKRWRKKMFSKESVVKKEALSEAPEGRAVPSKRTPLDTSPVGVFCSMQTGRSYGTLPRGWCRVLGTERPSGTSSNYDLNRDLLP